MGAFPPGNFCRIEKTKITTWTKLCIALKTIFGLKVNPAQNMEIFIGTCLGYTMKEQVNDVQ